MRVHTIPSMYAHRHQDRSWLRIKPRYTSTCFTADFTLFADLAFLWNNDLQLVVILAGLLPVGAIVIAFIIKPNIL